MPTAPSSSSRRVSLRDVGKAVGVSHVTVSLALRGDQRIPAGRREEIRAVATQLGYQPDPMLASLSAYRHAKRSVGISSTIAWLNQWPEPKALRRLREFAAYWDGAAAAAQEFGYRLEEFLVARDFTPDRLRRILTQRGVRGILVPPHAQEFSLPGFDWSGFSVVRLGVSVREPRAHVVTSDQMNCAILACARIVQHGYRRIGFISSERFDRNTGGNFRAGYLSSQDARLPTRSRLSPLFLAEENSPAEAHRLQTWLRRARPEAVLSTNPFLRGLLTRIAVKVPDDLAVAGISVLDGNFDAGVDQNSLEIGRVAMATLAGLIQQNERGLPQYCRRILVEGRWVDGASLPSRNGASRDAIPIRNPRATMSLIK